MLQLVKFTELATLLDLSKPSLDDYPSLKLLISSVYAAFESYTGRYLESSQYTETVDPDGRLVPLRALPIAAVSSVTIEGDTLTTLDYSIRADGLRLAGAYDARVVVVYTGGYEEAPNDIRRAALLQIAHEWQRKETIGATNVSTEGGNTSWPELGLLKEVRRLLDAHTHASKFV